MGLFSNNKKPCPICGSPTPRILPVEIEGMAICRECIGKADLPDDRLYKMSLEDLRQYVAFYDGNAALRDAFQETFSLNCGGWGDYLLLDTNRGLFRLKTSERSIVLEASHLKGFRVFEDDLVLFESSPEGLQCYPSHVPARAEALMPVVAQFELQRQQYEHFKEMERMVKERHGEDSGSSSYVSRPWFDHQVMNDFTVELTIEHPYWGGVRRYECTGPRFDRDYPHVEDFLNDYYKQTDNLHTLASHLMHFIDPDAPETRVMPDAPADTARAMPAVDAADEIRKYKELLDCGAITAEEFAAKKKQLLGI